MINLTLSCSIGGSAMSGFEASCGSIHLRGIEPTVSLGKSQAPCYEAGACCNMLQEPRFMRAMRRTSGCVLVSRRKVVEWMEGNDNGRRLV